MDNIGLCTSLVPELHVCWTLWDNGQRRQAYQRFGDWAQREFGIAQFDVRDSLLESEHQNRFPSAIQRILSEPYRLNLPPAHLAAEVWKQTPSNEMLSAILLGDLRWSDDPFEEEPSSAPGAEQLAALFEAQLRAGFLSRDEKEFPLGGRPVLSQPLLEATEARSLGAVWAVTRDVPSSAASHWWAAAAELLPRVVVRLFLHTVFGRQSTQYGSPERNWSRVQQRHDAFASAVRSSLNRIRDEMDEQQWKAAATYIARVEALRFGERVERLVFT